MKYERICEDCGNAFLWHTEYKKLCLPCGKKHRKLDNIKYNHSFKGMKCYERRKAKLREETESPYNTTPKNCLNCGKKIRHERTRCRPCYMKYLKNRPHFEHPNFKGEIVSQGDYMFIYKPEHYRANKRGYVRHHIYVWEQITGEKLPKGGHVHHLNGMKKDNRPANLVGLPNKKHYLVLQAKAKRIQELEALLNKQHQLI